LRLKVLNTNLIILLTTIFYPLCANYVVLSRVSSSSSHLGRTVVSEKMIQDDLSRVEESATKSTYKLGVGFERCEDNDEKRTPKFVPTSNYHKEEEIIKSTKLH
jgi:hypothetical protein